MIAIKKLDAERWKDCRDLRLEALKGNPTAFGSSFEEESTFAEAEWRKRIKNAIFALSHDKPIGMIVYIFSSRVKTKHIANIFGVYVKINFRGQGVGRKLIESALSEIQKNKLIHKIKLTVNPEQTAAVRLYEQYGFKIVGKLEKELKVGNSFFDELIMEKLLNTTGIGLSSTVKHLRETK